SVLFFVPVCRRLRAKAIFSRPTSPDSMRFAFAYLVALGLNAAAAQSPAAPNTFDESRPPGENFDKADFRMWVPENAGQLRGVVALVPGSNGDGRPMVADTMWQAFA